MSPTSGEFKFTQRRSGGDLADFTGSTTITLSPWDEETEEEKIKKQLDRIEKSQAEIKTAIFILSVIAGLAYAAAILLNQGIK